MNYLLSDTVIYDPTKHLHKNNLFELHSLIDTYKNYFFSKEDSSVIIEFFYPTFYRPSCFTDKRDSLLDIYKEYFDTYFLIDADEVRNDIKYNFENLANIHHTYKPFPIELNYYKHCFLRSKLKKSFNIKTFCLIDIFTNRDQEESFYAIIIESNYIVGFCHNTYQQYNIPNQTIQMIKEIKKTFVELLDLHNPAFKLQQKIQINDPLPIKNLQCLNVSFNQQITYQLFDHELWDDFHYILNAWIKSKHYKEKTFDSKDIITFYLNGQIDDLLGDSLYGDVPSPSKHNKNNYLTHFYHDYSRNNLSYMFDQIIHTYFMFGVFNEKAMLQLLSGQIFVCVIPDFFDNMLANYKEYHNQHIVFNFFYNILRVYNGKNLMFVLKRSITYVEDELNYSVLDEMASTIYQIKKISQGELIHTNKYHYFFKIEDINPLIILQYKKAYEQVLEKNFENDLKFIAA